MPARVTAHRIPLRTFAAMTENTTPAMPGDIDPRHVFLTAKEVIVRFGWGRTYGYQMLKSSGFPRRIGGRYRLDTLMNWEDRVLSGEIPGDPDSSSPPPTSDPSTESDARHSRDFDADRAESPTEQSLDDVSPDPVEAPRRRRTRGTGRAA